jgi:DNA-binding transcriptional ArsR family regulator
MNVILNGRSKYKVELLRKLADIMSELYDKREYKPVTELAIDVGLSIPTVYKYLTAVRKDKSIDQKVRRYIKKCYKVE